MQMKPIHIVEGWTDPLDFKLRIDGETFDASGSDVELILRDKDGNLIDLGGTVSWADEAESTARYAPASDDFDADLSPYYARWKVTDIDSKVSFFPTGQRGDAWYVAEP